MDKKLHWPSTVACICLMLSASRAQTPVAATRPASLSSMTNATSPPAVSSTGRLVDSQTTRASSTSGPGPRNATAAAPAAPSTAGPAVLTNQSTTKNPTTVTSQPRSSRPDRTTVAWDKKWDAAFTYDYSSLRHAGLAIAGVLFIMGILVISCGSKYCRVRTCRVSKGKSYQVSRD